MVTPVAVWVGPIPSTYFWCVFYVFSLRWGPIYKISYDLSYDYLKFIVRSSYDSDLRRAKVSLRNVLSQYTNTISDDLTILQVNRAEEKHCVLRDVLVN